MRRERGDREREREERNRGYIDIESEERNRVDREREREERNQVEALGLFFIDAWRSWLANRSQFARFLRIFCLPVSAQFPKQLISACNVAILLFILQNRAPANRIMPKSLPRCASRMDKVILPRTSHPFHVHA